MKAAVHEKYGPPGVLRIREIEKPAVEDQEVLIRVFATTVNRTDCAMLRARPFIMRFFTGLRKPRKAVLGTDFAGRVEAVGKNVTTFKVGDKVFGFDDAGLSSHAGYMTLSQHKALTTIPEGISFEQAAASLEGAHYAYNFINKINIQKGERVLVNGATGAIGSAAVQLLKLYAPHITAVCSTRNLDLVKSIGADRVIDYTKEDFTAAGHLQQHEKYHYIFDAVGKSSFAKCKPLLHAGGVYMSSELGSMVQNPFLALVTPVIASLPGMKGSKKVIFPIPLNKKKSVLLIKKLLEEGKFKAVIDRRYPLEEIAEAFRFVETGEKTGNVLITYVDGQSG